VRWLDERDRGRSVEAKDLVDREHAGGWRAVGRAWSGRRRRGERGELAECLDDVEHGVIAVTTAGQGSAVFGQDDATRVDGEILEVDRPDQHERDPRALLTQRISQRSLPVRISKRRGTR
jgi:hypothetical protein